MERKLPVFKLTIDDEDSGVDYVALVDHPAIEREWVAFSKEKSSFKVLDKELQILSGPLMIADLPIYRKSPSMGEYYAVFDGETIEKIVQRYFKKKFTSNVNIMHDAAQKVDDVYMFESFIINRGRGVKPPKGFEGVTDGSWFGTFKVDNKDVWETFIKSGELKGFSVEGEFFHEPFEERKQSEIEQVIEIISSIKV
jgi:hypothetical protein